MDPLVAWLATKLIYAVALGAVVGYLTARRVDRMPLAVAAVVSAASGLVLAWVAGLLWYHERPFAAEGFTPLVARAADNGFPSSQVSLTMAVAVAVAMRRPAVGLPLAFIGVLFGAARVLAGLHYPIDIVASVAIGLTAGVIGEYAARWWVRRGVARTSAKTPSSAAA